jgi:hypothetical protein
MSRRGVQNVTILPALVPCEFGEEDGFVHLATPVRIVTTDEVVNGYKKWKESRSQATDKVDWRTLGGMSLFKFAVETRDLTAGHKAAKMLEPYLKTMIKPSGSDPADELLTNITFAVAYEAKDEQQWFLPRFMTAALKGANPVFWTPGKSKGPFSPCQLGMFCPTYEVAAAYRLFCNGLRICLHCQTLFTQKRANHTCCSLKCREAHRVAEWREKKKASQARSEAKKKRGRR